MSPHVAPYGVTDRTARTASGSQVTAFPGCLSWTAVGLHPKAEGALSPQAGDSA